MQELVWRLFILAFLVATLWLGWRDKDNDHAKDVPPWTTEVAMAGGVVVAVLVLVSMGKLIWKRVFMQQDAGDR